MVKPVEELPVLFFEDQNEWEKWLGGHHLDSAGIWLQLAKKGSGLESVTYAEALDIALCYGWIDSQKKAYDDKTWLQKFTPRGAKSVWSKVNKEKVEKLVTEGRMKEAGLKAVELAKANGEWERAYASQSKATVPEDLAAELATRPLAKAFFETLDSANRYAILYRLQSAKKPETRQKRLEKFVEMLENGEKIH